MSEQSKLKAAITAAGIIALGALATPAMAYGGPGAGLSAIGSVLSFLGVIVLMIVGFVWYPVKRLLRRRRNAKAGLAKHER